MEQFTGLEYIKIDLANQFGLDKKNWDVRLNWVDKKNAIPNELDKMVILAKEPVLFAKALNALRDAEAGIATGFIMGLDATSSGLQIMAALSGCHITAANVNLINTGNRENAYARVARLIYEKCGIQFTAEEVKKPVMTTFYNSKAQPKQVFGEDASTLAAFYETLNELFPGAMNVLQAIQQFQNPNALEYVWTLLDQHTAKVKVMMPVDKKIEIDELNHATFTHRAYINQPTDFDLSLPANITQSIDGWVVRDMYDVAAKQLFELLTIHDSFWASPNYMQNVRENYRDSLVTIAESNLLETILQEISGNPKLTYTKFSNNLGAKIRKAEYCLS